MGNEYYITIITLMKEKFDKYFDHLPHFSGLAIIIDPRCKEISLQEFLELLFVDQIQFAPIMQTCNKLFQEYRAAEATAVSTYVNTLIHTTLAVQQS